MLFRLFAYLNRRSVFGGSTDNGRSTHHPDLLGSLSAEETERLDELSLTDDEFAGRLQAVENELIDAYVEGELSGQTLEQFNSFYLSSPKRRERVRFAQVFRTVAERSAVGLPAATSSRRQSA